MLQILFVLVLVAMCSVNALLIPRRCFSSLARTSQLRVPPSSYLTNPMDNVLAMRGGKGVLEPSTVADLDALLKDKSAAGKIFVIDFSASWCGPCQIIAPFFHDLATDEQYASVNFIKIDVDESPDIAAAYTVSSMPTFVFVRDNVVVERFSGANRQKIKDTINNLLAKK